MKAQHGHHITPLKTLLSVFAALIGLTVLTAVTAQIDLGRFNVPLALLIAGSKALLVIMYFMALKYDKRINTLVFALGGVFVLVFLTLTLFDTAFRGDLGNVGAQTISDQERIEEMARQRESQLGTQRPSPAPAAPADTEAAQEDTTDASSEGDTTEASSEGDTTDAPTD